MRKGFLFEIYLLACLFCVDKDIFALPDAASLLKPKSANVKFIENKNQWEDFIRYEADFKGGKLFLEDSLFTYVFYNPDDIQSLHPHEGNQLSRVRLHAIKVHAVGGNKHPIIEASDKANYFHNYFKGRDPSKWASDVPLFTAVTYQNIFSNIDLKFYSNQADIKYDLIIHPDGNAANIAFQYDGVDEISIRKNELVMKLSVGTIVEQKPFAYQVINGITQEVICKFVLKNKTVGFRFPDGYNKNYPLIIDPTLIFSSYSGSTADNWGFTATYDEAGNMYSGGHVNDIGFPVTAGAYDLQYHGGSHTDGSHWACDMAIAKYNSSGTALLYATYIGGSSNEQPQSLIVDGNNDLVIFGTTFSPDFPTTIDAFDTTYNGNGDITVSKLSPNGNMLVASTFVGGTESDGLNTSPRFYESGPLKYNYSDEARGEIISDQRNNYFVGSCTKSADFPTTPGSFQQVFNGGPQDGLVFKMDSSLSTLVWSTYLGGTLEDAVYDATIAHNGDIYLAGGTNSLDFPVTPGTLHSTYQGGRADGFLVRLNSNGSSIVAGTFIGTDQYDQTYFLELDYSGNVYTTGQTEGDYPVTPGVYSNANSKQFIHKLTADLDTTFYSTVFGSGSSFPNISPTAFLVDTCENVYVAGWGRCLSLGVFTEGNALGMPITPDAFQTSTSDGCDFYFFVLSHDANSLLYGSFFGGSSSWEHVDGGTSRFNKNGTIYESVCAGCGGRDDFPTTPGVVSNTNNSDNCNNGVIKFAFNLTATVARIAYVAPASNCAPYTLPFVNNSTNGDMFIWDFGDGSPLDTSFAPIHTYIDTGVYQVMLVAVNPTSCYGNDTSFATVTVPSGSPVIASFDFSQITPCDTFVSVEFTGAGGHIYDWNFGDGFVASGINASHHYTDTGTFIVSLAVYDTVCTVQPDTLSQAVSFHTDVHASAVATGDTSGCAPLLVSFNNNNSTPTGTYSWNFMDGTPEDSSRNPTHVFNIPGNYNTRFVVHDPFSCNGSDTSYVPIVVLPSIPVIASFDLNIYPGCDTLIVATTFNGLGGDYYYWNFGDGNQSTGLSAVHQYDHLGPYQLTLEVEDTVCDRIYPAVQTVTIPSVLHAAINSIHGNSGCAPNTVLLSSFNPLNGTFVWHFGDGTTSTSNPVTHVYDVPGIYIVRLAVIDSATCNINDTDLFLLNVYPTPVAGFTYDDEMPHFINNDIVFSDKSTNASIYDWRFDDEISGSGPNVTHQFKTGGYHDVYLYTSNQDGCLDTAYAKLEVLESELIYAPNVFTPNGDGTNDEFKVYQTGIKDMELLIYNRWGIKIFETHSLNASWDGTVNGEMVPNDTYIWKLKAHGEVSGLIEKSGQVTIVR